MKRRLVIDGNSVYELDEDCMLQKKAKKHSDSRTEEGRREENNRQREQKEQEV